LQSIPSLGGCKYRKLFSLWKNFLSVFLEIIYTLRLLHPKFLIFSI